MRWGGVNDGLFVALKKAEGVIREISFLKKGVAGFAMRWGSEMCGAGDVSKSSLPHIAPIEWSAQIVNIQHSTWGERRVA